MDFVNLGKHCFLCKFQCYLPHFCEHCKQYTCDEHRTCENHDCISIKKINTKRKKQIKNKKKCKICNVKIEYPTSAKCIKCKNLFCPKHRLLENHLCPKQYIEKYNMFSYENMINLLKNIK